MMRYRLFFYKTTAAVTSAPAIDTINAALINNSEEEWDDWAAEDLDFFDCHSVMLSLETQLTDSDSGLCLCKALTRFPPKKHKQVPFIYVVTSYEKAAEALPKLHAIAAEYDLALYDAETNKTFYRDLIDRDFITMRLRQQIFHNEILNTMNPVWKIRKLAFCADEQNKSCDYVVTLKKDPEVSFEDRVRAFYFCLSNNITDTETLLCEDYCYKIVGEQYQITYTLEGYKKHANQLGYENHRSKLLERMSTEDAFRWMMRCSNHEVEDIFSRMHFEEMTNAYPNPADRFVASVNITKWQRKQVFNVRYSNIGYYGSEILFHIVPDQYYHNGGKISVLKIEESSATFILPFIDDIYPYFRTDYYYDENHLCTEMWRQIIKRLVAAKELILHDTFSPKLDGYIDKFNLFLLAKSNADDAMIRTNKRQFVYAHRYDIANLYDVFIHWSNAQIKAHCGCDDRMLNVQGP